LELVRGFVGTAANGHRIGRSVVKSRSGLAQAIKERKAGGFFNADESGTNTEIGERGGGDFCRTFVFLPDANFQRKAHLFAQPALFEGRYDQDGATVAGH
jgi:hypothetical protein